MKIKFILTTILAIGFQLTHAQTQKQAVELQRGSGQDCFGSKANCTFQTQALSEAGKLNAKYLAYALDEHTLVLEVQNEKLNAQEKAKITAVSFKEINANEPTYFEMEEYFVMDKESLILLGVNPVYNTIDIGKYPIVKIDNKLLITIPLKKYEHID